jgi:perosamine synthetase
MISVSDFKLNKKDKNAIIKELNISSISSSGKRVLEFEKKFSKYQKKKYGVTASNGTAALDIAVRSLNLPKGSEVILPTFSIISTLLPIINCGLKPIFIDCEQQTFNTSIDSILKSITKKTKLIIVTHIYGLAVDTYKLKKKYRKKF